MKELKAGKVLVDVCGDEYEIGSQAARRVLNEIVDVHSRGKKPVLWLMAAPSGFVFYRVFCELVQCSNGVAAALEDPSATIEQMMNVFSKLGIYP